MSTPAAQAGDHFRAEPDDGCRYTLDPVDDTGVDPTPWRVDTARSSDWIAARDLPPSLVPVSHGEFLAWNEANR